MVVVNTSAISCLVSTDRRSWWVTIYLGLISYAAWYDPDRKKEDVKVKCHLKWKTSHVFISCNPIAHVLKLCIRLLYILMLQTTTRQWKSYFVPILRLPIDYSSLIFSIKYRTRITRQRSRIPVARLPCLKPCE